MSSTDERTVKMTFENTQFMKGAKESKTALDSVNTAVDKTSKSKGLLNLGSQAQVVGGKLKTMGVIGVTALATITAKAVNAGLHVVKALTFDPIKMGFDLYQTELTKLNTIMNATGKSRGVVQAALNNLNAYANKTIYKFGDMTSSLTKFVNAGLSLDKSVKLTKQFANMVAYAGGTAEEATRGFYALTQMEQLGYVGLQDFKQFDNASLATTKFKQAMIDAAVAQGTLTKMGDHYVDGKGKEVKATGNFNQTLQDQWATTKVLNTAIAQYGRGAGEMGKKAFAAAQNVRTFSAFMDQFKEQMGTGWSRIFRGLIGNLNDSTKLWTNMSNTLGQAIWNIGSFGDAALYAWRKFGGFDAALQGVKNILAPFGALISTVGKAFREAFPPGRHGVGMALVGLSKGFEAITSPLQLLAKGIRATEPLMVAFFRLLHIGSVGFGEIVGSVVHFVTAMLGLVHLNPPARGGLWGYIKAITSAIGDAIKQVNDLLNKGKNLGQAFGSLHIKLPKIPKINLPDLGGFGSGISAGAGKAQSSIAKIAAGAKALVNNLKGVKGASGDVQKAGISIESIKQGLARVGALFKAIGSGAKSFGDVVGKIFAGIAQGLSNAFSHIDFASIVKSFNLAVFTTMVIQIVKVMNSFQRMMDGFSHFLSVADGINAALEGAGKGLESFQTRAKAKLILNIAIAVGILALSLALLAFIPAKKLGNALLALGEAMFEMALFAKVLAKVVEGMGDGVSLKLTTLSFALVAMAAAILLLAISFLVLQHVKLQGIVKGMATMFAVMLMFQGLGKIAKESYRNILAAGVAMVAISGAMLLLAAAFIAFGLVKWESMGKAGAALAGLTVSLAILSAMPTGKIAKVGLALLTASLGLDYMAVAMIAFGHVKWESIGKAAVVLLLLTVSLIAIAKVGGPEAVAGFIALAAAMVLMTVSLLGLNKVNWSSIGKLAVVLTVLLVAVAALFGILYLAAPVVPILLLFAGALALLGVGLVAFAAAMAIAISLGAAGVAAFAALGTGAAVAVGVFFQTLASEAPVISQSVLAMLKAAIDTIVAAVPMVIDGIKRLIKAIVKEFQSPDGSKGAGDGAQSMLSKFMDKVQEWIPKIVAKGVDLIKSFLKGLASHASEIAGTAVKLVTGLVKGITSHIGQLIDAGADLIIAFIDGLGKNGVKIANAAGKAIVKFLNGLAAATRTYTPQIISAGSKIGIALIEGIVQGIGEAAHNAYSAITGVMSKIIGIAKKIPIIRSPSHVFNDIGQFLIMGLTAGIQAQAANAIMAVGSVMTGAISLASSYMDQLTQDLDQRTAAAVGKANGLALAAQKAAALADKTKKNKKDDKQAKKLGKEATAAQKAADAAQAASDAQHAADDRADEYNKAATIDKAKMKSEDAQNQLDAAKSAEAAAEADRQAAAALKAQAKKRGISAAEAKKLNAQAAALLVQAQNQAKAANAAVDASRNSAAAAIQLQQQAGAEAAAAFQAAYDADAKAAADAAAFDKLSDADKAVQRRKDAEELQAKSETDLAQAKQLAYTDLDGANTLAQQALDEANTARQYLSDAEGYEASGGAATGTVLNIDPSAQALAAFNDYKDSYDSATAAAAATRVVELNQYNSSPEALSPSEIYRQTNNLLTYAADKLAPAEAA